VLDVAEQTSQLAAGTASDSSAKSFVSQLLGSFGSKVTQTLVRESQMKVAQWQMSAVPSTAH
jgi:hypothetical protein